MQDVDQDVHLRVNENALGATGGRPKNEAYYRDYLAKIFNGKIEVSTGDDNRRCDIVTEEIAFEVDWASKFYEAVGQASLYAQRLNRKPGIFLICKEPKDERFIRTAMEITRNTKVQVGDNEYHITLLVIRDYT